jgi:hypothetical protein
MVKPRLAAGAGGCPGNGLLLATVSQNRSNPVVFDHGAAAGFSRALLPWPPIGRECALNRLNQLKNTEQGKAGGNSFQGG